jgi:NAD(P)-dependent dehydrogenase (short-subunit alcohol dehydrogenase family)
MSNMKVAVITGAAKGIGKEIALAFARDGFHIAACSRTQSDLEKLEDEVKAKRGSVIAEVCDITDEKDVISFLEQVKKLHGNIDVLVNNAAVAYVSSVEDTALSIWEETLRVNLTGTFLMTKYSLKHMQTGSHIFNIGSNASKTGFPKWSAYCASKFGVLGFTNSLRTELRPRGVKVTAILPGPTKTPLWESLDGNWDKSKMMSPKSIAEMIIHIYNQPADVQTEEVFIIPNSGGL